MKIYSRTDIGKKRSINQDAYYVGEFDDGTAFAIVCDGMGGHMAGDIASARAISIISEYIKKSYSPKMIIKNIYYDYILALWRRNVKKFVNK